MESNNYWYREPKIILDGQGFQLFSLPLTCINVGMFMNKPEDISVLLTTYQVMEIWVRVNPDRRIRNICNCTYENPKYGNILGKRQLSESEDSHFLGLSPLTIFLSGVPCAEPLALLHFMWVCDKELVVVCIAWCLFVGSACKVLAWWCGYQPLPLEFVIY